MTILVSMMLMMLMAELLRGMGTPISRICLMIWPLVEQNFNVKERRLRTRVDFDAERPSVYLYAAATLTAGQALALGLRLTTRCLAEFSKYRAEAGSPATSKQKEAV